METATLAVSSVLVFFIVLCAAVIVLQIFLSKKENKWAGLILPFISFSFSLLTVLGILLYTTNTGTIISTVDGETVGQAVTTVITPASSIKI